MNLQTQDCYLPVSKEESPFGATIQRGKMDHYYVKLFIDRYPLTKQEIIKLVGDAFKWGRWHQAKFPNAPNLETYIDNLFK